MVPSVSRVLFLSRTTLFSVPGGDTTQIVKTAEALREAGLHVDISTDLTPDVSSYDLVHLFNLMRPQELYLQATHAKAHGKKVALSTIYGPYTEFDRKARSGPGRLAARLLPHNQLEYLKVLARAVVNREVNRGTAALLRHGYRGLQDALIELVDVFLPNSESEMKRVHSDFPRSRSKPVSVVPNAVDTRLFDPATVVVPPELEKYRGCVLSVARIEGRKCQLELVRATRGADFPVVIIGKPAPNHHAYFDKIRREAAPNVHFVGQVDHAQLPSYYKVAAAHCLISWMETPGLSSLEAGAMGTNVVVTRKGDTYDYFEDLAHYCEPDSIDSIRAAITGALAAPPNGRLRSRILEQFTWQKAAEHTLEGYRLSVRGT